MKNFATLVIVIFICQQIFSEDLKTKTKQAEVKCLAENNINIDEYVTATNTDFKEDPKLRAFLICFFRTLNNQNGGVIQPEITQTYLDLTVDDLNQIMGLAKVFSETVAPTTTTATTVTTETTATPTEAVIKRLVKKGSKPNKVKKVLVVETVLEPDKVAVVKKGLDLANLVVNIGRYVKSGKRPTKELWIIH